MSNKNLKNLFNKNSTLGSALTTNTYKTSNDFIVNEELEGLEFLKEKAKEINNFKFNVDYSDPANFAKFASAYLYYNDSINYTLDSFPYDGSKEKYQIWRNQSTDLDKYLIDNEWPRYSGYLNMGGNTSDAIDPAYDGWYYGLETVQQYEFIEINGYAENSLFSSLDKKNDAFNLSFSDGFTIEFFMRFPSDKEFGVWPLFCPRQPIFSLATDDDFNFNIIFDASSSTVKFGVNYYAGFGSQLPDDEDEFCFIETDMSNSYDIWNHVAIIFNLDNIKIYINGVLSGTRTFAPITIPNIIILNEWNLKGLIGVCYKYGYFYGKLWAHLDEFRIWKEPRTEKQINDNMFCNVRGTATELNKETNLSVYYKFNEPDESGNIIVDYSGRLVNGNFTAFSYFTQDYVSNFSSQGRRVRFANDDLSPVTYEKGDIILYNNNADFLAFKDSILQAGLDYDIENGKTLFQRLPSWISEEDSETSQDLKKLTQIIGSYLDNLYLKIYFLNKLKHISYDGIGNEEFYKFAIKNLGFPVIEIFDSADTINLFLDKNDGVSFEEKLSNIKTIIYQNLYNNITPILKTKGTKNSIDNLLHSLSIPDNLFNLNFYSNSDIEHTGKLKDYFKNIQFLNLNYSDSNYNLFGESVTLWPQIKITHLHDYETNIKIKVPTYNTTNFNNLSASVVSLHDIINGLALYSLYYVRKNSTSNEIKLVANYLKSGSTSYSLETDYFNTNNSYLDVSVGFSKNSTLTSSSILPDKFNIFAKIDHNDTISASVSITNISSSYINNFYNSDYELNAGRNRLTNVFTNIGISNISLSRISNLSDVETDDSTHAVIQPWQQNFEKTENNFNQMFLNFDLSKFEYADGLYFYNNCSNAQRDYEFDETDLEEYTMDFQGPILSSEQETKEKFYIIDKINLKAKENPGQYNISNDINVLESDDEFFTKNSRPINVFFNLERSIYGILNDRIMKVFKTFEDFATIYSPQIEFYRVENKSLIKLRDELLKTIDSPIDVDKFQEYYKWLDYDLSDALKSIIPASANSDRQAKNIIESHNLERNKLTRYLLAPTTPKKVTNEAILYGEKNLSVVYKTEKYTSNPYYSKNWWKYHAPRDTDTVSEVGIFPFSSSVDGINDARERFRELAVQERALSNNFAINLELIKPIEIGQNNNFNEGLIRDSEYISGELDGTFINDQTYDDFNSLYKRKILNGLKATLSNGKIYNYKFFEPYRWSNLITGSSVDDDTYFSRSPIKQVKSLMSPFTEKYNNRKFTQNYLVEDPSNNKVFPKFILFGSLNKIAVNNDKKKEFALPEEFERIYSTNLTKLTGSQFGNYSNNRENVQYGEISDNNPGFKQALFVATGDELNNLTQCVSPFLQINYLERPFEEQEEVVEIEPTGLNDYTLTRKTQLEDGGLLTLVSPTILYNGNTGNYQELDYGIGFSFKLVGTTYTIFRAINTNGFVRLSTNNVDGNTPSEMNAVSNSIIIAPWWSDNDMQSSTGSRLKTELQGSSPNRVRIIEWTEVLARQSSGPYTDFWTGEEYSFQLCLYETSNRIEFRYGTAADLGSPFTPIGSTKPGAIGIKLNTTGSQSGNIRDFFGSNGTPAGSDGPFTVTHTILRGGIEWPGSASNTSGLGAYNFHFEFIQPSPEPVHRELTFGTASYSSRESSYKQRFSAPGDYWNSAFNSVYTSPYGTVNYRNIRVNKYLNTRYALPSLFGGLESGSTTTGSIHKIYRNSNSSSMYYEYNRNNSWHTPFNADLPRAKFDNFFVQHAIPNNIRRYSDLVAFDKSQKVYYSIYHAELYKNMLLGNYIGFRNSGSSGYAYGQDGWYFDPNNLTRDVFVSTTNRMYDTIVRLIPDFEERQINFDTTSAKEDIFQLYYDYVEPDWLSGYYNSYFLKLSAPKWVGWTQLRASDNQIFNYMKKNNLITKVSSKKNWLDLSTIQYQNNYSFVSQSFINYDNHDYEVEVEYNSYNFETGKEEIKKEKVYTQKPYKLLNSNKELIQKVLPNLSDFDKIKDNKYIKINKIKYISSLYPKNEYVGSQNIRDKRDWTQTDSSIRLFNRRTFWRDDYNNRLLENIRTSQGVIFEGGSIYSLEGNNLNNESAPVFEVGELKLAIGDNEDYALKPYIQYLSPSTFIKFNNITYNRNVNSILEQTDKRPYFDSYQDYVRDMKKYSQYSIIPEYNVSENTSSIDGRTDSTLLIQNSGTIFESENFHDYITTNQIVANSPVKAKIKASAIKKLNPYKGFYPSDYTAILAEAFSSSYCDSFSGTYWEADDNIISASVVDASPMTSKDVGYVGALKSLFGSGMIFNSIKAGIGYDHWLPAIGNLEEENDASVTYFFISGSEKGNYGVYNTLNKYKRLNFNNIITDSIFNKNLSYFENESMCDSPLVDSSIKSKLIQYYYINNPKNNTFRKKINNFFSECENFYLNKNKITSKEQKFFTFSINSLYSMNIKVGKTDDYFNILGPSSSVGTHRGSVFGAPHIFDSSARRHIDDSVTPNIISTTLITCSNGEAINATDPSYLPYTPSYYYNNTSITLNFQPDKEKYTLDEIFASSSIDFKDDGSSYDSWYQIYSSSFYQMHISSSANLNRTQVTHTLDIFEKSYLPKEGSFGNIKTLDANDSNPSWEIKTKFESPLLYFGESQNYPSGGGMWMDYGTYSDTEGAYVSISDVSGALSFADAVGFKKKDYRVGELKEQKEIEECLILIPVDKLGNKLFSSDEKDEREKMLDKYVFPSHLDWKFNKKIRPFIFHAIEFSSILSREDLADIWQGLMPSISYKMEEDNKVLDIDLTEIEKEQIKIGLSYIVFKVKKRAKYDFAKHKNDEKDEVRYSYNWPYDYCSLVELCKIDIEIEEEI